jgi:pimeloyl-ACP methyl ester carboxylesterase
VILIHGSPGGRATWKQVLPKLSNYFVLVPDRPGYGGSSPGKAETSLAAQSTRIWEALRTHLDGRPAIVVGYSYGGAVALRMVADQPGDVAGLVLLAATVNPAYENLAWYYRPGRWPWLNWLLPRDYVVSATESAALPAELRLLDWSSYELPVRIVQGKADDVVDPRSGAWALARLVRSTDAQLEMVPGLKHDLPEKRPTLVEQAVRSLLD